MSSTPGLTCTMWNIMCQWRWLVRLLREDRWRRRHKWKNERLLLLRWYVDQHLSLVRHTALTPRPHGRLTPFFSGWSHHSCGKTTVEFQHLDSCHCLISERCCRFRSEKAYQNVYVNDGRFGFSFSLSFGTYQRPQKGLENGFQPYRGCLAMSVGVVKNINGGFVANFLVWRFATPKSCCRILFRSLFIVQLSTVSLVSHVP